MRTPHRRDISARQDLLGRELRQLFTDYVEEDVPEELQKLALQLQSAVEARPPAAPAGAPDPSLEPSPPKPRGKTAPVAPEVEAVSSGEAPTMPAVAAGKPSIQG